MKNTILIFCFLSMFNSFCYSQEIKKDSLCFFFGANLNYTNKVKIPEELLKSNSDISWQTKRYISTIYFSLQRNNFRYGIQSIFNSIYIKSKTDYFTQKRHTLNTTIFTEFKFLKIHKFEIFEGVDLGIVRSYDSFYSLLNQQYPNQGITKKYFPTIGLRNQVLYKVNPKFCVQYGYNLNFRFNKSFVRESRIFQTHQLLFLWTFKK